MLIYLSILLIFIIIFLKIFLIFYTLDNSKNDEHINKSFQEKKDLIISNFNQLHGKIKLKKNTSHLYRSRVNDNQKLNLNFLQKVIEVNLQENWVHVESLMTYRDLIKFTLEIGKIPLIVPEFSSLTVGGVISGVGLESSSFRYGLTYDTAIEYTVLCGDGIIRVANQTTNKELFDAIPNSYGSFGYILSVKIKIRDYRPYIEIENIKFNCIKTFINVIKKYCSDDDIDFVDGFINNKNEMYLQIGKLVNDVQYGTHIEKFVENIYYKRVIKSQEKIYMKIEDYFWRYDYNCFYLGGIFENKFLRKFLGQQLRSDKIKKIGELLNFVYNSRESIINDLGVKLDNLQDFLNWYDEYITVYPVWICPYKIQRNTHFFEEKGSLMVDFGIGFGVNKEKHNSDPNYYKKIIDNKMFELKAKKGLYSTTFLSEDNFWLLYGSKEKYMNIKEKYDPHDRFYNLYQKSVIQI
jgi:hypothetical protein